MSLLDQWNYEVVVYPEEVVIDRDGNKRTKASTNGIPLKVWIAPLNQSGTAARRSEQDKEGYETEKVVKMRLRRKDEHVILGSQSKVQWGEEMWSLFGDPAKYNGSSRTKHMMYTLRRA